MATIKVCVYGYLSHQISCNNWACPLALIWNPFLAFNCDIHWEITQFCIAMCVSEKITTNFLPQKVQFDFHLAYYGLYCTFLLFCMFAAYLLATTKMAGNEPKFQHCIKMFLFVAMVAIVKTTTILYSVEIN